MPGLGRQSELVKYLLQKKEDWSSVPSTPVKSQTPSKKGVSACITSPEEAKMSEFLGLVRGPVTQSRLLCYSWSWSLTCTYTHRYTCTCTCTLYRHMNMHTSASLKSHICTHKIWKSKKSDKLLCVPLQCHCNRHVTSPSPPKSILSFSPIACLPLGLAKGHCHFVVGTELTFWSLE